MKRHPFDPVSFLLGAIVLIVGFQHFTDDFSLVWMWPTILVGLGLTLLAAAAKRHTGNRAR